MKLTIGIKALNEEHNIAAALDSAVKAAQPWQGEVILADSGSSDRTVEIASTYPVHVIQLADTSQRSCGAGAQLAFQSARGEYFYLLDGDMVLDPGFLNAAIPYLEAHPELAAVGGRVREINTEAHDFKIRAATVQSDSNWMPGEVDQLDCGGLYRTSAIQSVGHFADRNLHAFEEFELGARLRSHGWKLARIDHASVDHFGHQTGGYTLLWRRFKSGYSSAVGEVLRGALGRPHLSIVLRDLGHIRNSLFVVVWWVMLLAVLVVPVPMNVGFGLRAIVFLILLTLPAGLLAIRRRSLSLGVYSVAAWNISALGSFAGFFRHRTDPGEVISAVRLGQPAERRA